MPRRRTQPPSPYWNRVEAVMRVQRGETSVEDVVRDLGLSRMQYYRIEEAMLRAALEAVSPKKRGRKPKDANPEVAELRKRLAQVQRERELLDLKACELARVNAEMRRREIGAHGGKKQRRTAKARKAVSTRVSANGVGPSGRA